MLSVAEALPQEIARITRIKESYISMRGNPQINVEPAILMMTAEINQAVKALADGDVVQMLRSYQSLKEYDD